MILAVTVNNLNIAFTIFDIKNNKIVNTKYPLKKLFIKELNKLLKDYRYNYMIYKKIIEKFDIKLVIVLYTKLEDDYKLSFYQQIAIFNEIFDIDHVWYSMSRIKRDMFGTKEVRVSKLINYMSSIDKDFAKLDKSDKKDYYCNFYGFLSLKKYNEEDYQKLKSLSLNSSTDK